MVEKPAVYPTAAQSDPNRMGWMQGHPPPPERTIRYADGSYLRFPQTRWSYSHMREFGPTVAVSRQETAPRDLERAERAELDALPVLLKDGTTVSWLDSLALNYTDAILVLHRGRIVYERYFGAGTAQLPHITFSVTKSFVGTLAAIFVHDGSLDPGALVTRYVPELGQSAYADATVRQVMDMTVSVDCSEDYTDPKAGVWDMMRAAGAIPRGPQHTGPATLCAYMMSVPKLGEHDVAFAYRTVNTEVLAWILRRVSGLSLAALISTFFWRRLGVEYDAYLAVDPAGTELGGSGLSATLRDLGRFGEMMRCEGSFNGQQIVPGAVVADIRQGADPEKFARARIYSEHLPCASYRSMWWVTHNAHAAFSARGVHGQAIWIDPTAEMVIARLGSHHLAANIYLDPTSLPAYQAMGEYLLTHPVP